MPRATITVEVGDSAEVEAVERWFGRWAHAISHQFDDQGCGCCVDIWEVEVPTQALAELPPRAWSGGP